MSIIDREFHESSNYWYRVNIFHHLFKDKKYISKIFGKKYSENDKYLSFGPKKWKKMFQKFIRRTLLTAMNNVYEKRKGVHISNLMFCDLDDIVEFYHSNLEVLYNLSGFSVLWKLETIINKQPYTIEEQSAMVIQRNFRYYRDTPVDPENPNLKNTLWYKICIGNLEDICKEYNIKLEN
tara:strand:- start:154 stop:693 length:540 start_codon:yes stop_codon:yes gene_type:complete